MREKYRLTSHFVDNLSTRKMQISKLIADINRREETPDQNGASVEDILSRFDNDTFAGPYMYVPNNSHSPYYLMRNWIEAYTNLSLDTPCVETISRFPQKENVYVLQCEEIRMENCRTILTLSDYFDRVETQPLDIPQNTAEKMLGRLLIVNMVLETKLHETAATLLRFTITPFYYADLYSVDWDMVEAQMMETYSIYDGRAVMEPVPAYAELWPEKVKVSDWDRYCNYDGITFSSLYGAAAAFSVPVRARSYVYNYNSDKVRLSLIFVYELEGTPYRKHIVFACPYSIYKRRYVIDYRKEDGTELLIKKGFNIVVESRLATPFEQIVQKDGTVRIQRRGTELYEDIVSTDYLDEELIESYLTITGRDNNCRAEDPETAYFDLKYSLSGLVRAKMENDRITDDVREEDVVFVGMSDISKATRRRGYLTKEQVEEIRKRTESEEIIEEKQRELWLRVGIDKCSPRQQYQKIYDEFCLKHPPYKELFDQMKISVTPQGVIAETYNRPLGDKVHRLMREYGWMEVLCKS